MQENRKNQKNRPTGEEVRQARKFLQNKKVPLTLFKPNLFAAASKEINGNYDKTFNSLIDVYRAGNPYYKRRKENGQNTSSRSDTARNKKI